MGKTTLTWGKITFNFLPIKINWVVREWRHNRRRLSLPSSHFSGSTSRLLPILLPPAPARSPQGSTRSCPSSSPSSCSDLPVAGLFLMLSSLLCSGFPFLGYAFTEVPPASLASSAVGSVGPLWKRLEPVATVSDMGSPQPLLTEATSAAPPLPTPGRRHPKQM